MLITQYLMAVQENGEKLVMMDGTIWMVDPAEIKLSGLWVPPCPIEMENVFDNREYDFSLKNLDTGIIVSAKKRK